MTFLINCKTLNVFPKFLYIRLPNIDEDDKIRIRKSLLKSATRKRIKERDQLKKDADYQDNKMREIMSGFDFYVLQRAVGWNVNKTVNEVIGRQENKLHAFTEMTNIPFKSSDVITNLSKYELTTDELDILKNGLDYSIPPCKLNKTNIFYSYELICRSMLSNLVENKNDAKVRSELSHLANLYYSNYKPSRKPSYS